MDRFDARLAKLNVELDETQLSLKMIACKRLFAWFGSMYPSALLLTFANISLIYTVYYFWQERLVFVPFALLTCVLHLIVFLAIWVIIDSKDFAIELALWILPWAYPFMKIMVFGVLDVLALIVLTSGCGYAFEQSQPAALRFSFTVVGFVVVVGESGFTSWIARRNPPIAERWKDLWDRKMQTQEQIGREFEAQHKWRLRITELRSRKPTTPLGFAERGKDFLEAGLLDEALVNIDAAILMDPDCAEAHLWRGMIVAAQEKEKPKKP